MDKVFDFLFNLATTVGLKLVYAAVVLIVGLKLSKWLVNRIMRGKWANKLDAGLISFIKSFASILLNILIFISVAVILGIPTTSFITMLASAGVAIGLALQGALSNFAGGLMILFFKPFKIGDYIDAGSNSGTVTGITVFYTMLQTPDNKQITLPNGTLTNEAIVNYSASGERRVDLTFSVSYNADMETVKRLLLEAAQNHALVQKDPPPFARLDRQNDSSLDFVLRVWCKSEDYFTVYYDLTEQVKETFDANNIEIPYPQLDVHVQQN